MAGAMKLVNGQDFLNMLDELVPKEQNKVLMGGLRKAGKIINDQAKQNFKETQKNQSKTNYKGFASMFKVKKKKDKMSVIVGVQDYKKGYIYRFLDNNSGEIREYKTRAGNAGILPATHYFEKAVEAKQGEAQAAIEENVVLSMQKTVAKWNKKYSI